MGFLLYVYVCVSKNKGDDGDESQVKIMVSSHLMTGCFVSYPTESLCTFRLNSIQKSKRNMF